MTLETPEFIRRFLLHVLPPGFHRIRHYGLFANGGRTRNLARARELLAVEAPQDDDGAKDDGAKNDGAKDEGTEDDGAQTLSHPCPRCGGPMIVIETFKVGYTPSDYAARAPPKPGKGGRPKGERR